MKHQTLLGCKHPLVAVAMNQVSDLKLAVACQRAGILPSLSSFNFHVGGKLDHAPFLATLAEFANQTGSQQLLLSMSLVDLFDEPLLQALHGAGFRLIELFKWNVNADSWQLVLARCEALEAQHGFRFFFKLHQAADAQGAAVNHVILKGNDGAGRTDPQAGSLLHNVEQLRSTRPELNLVPSGGIGSADDVRQYLDRGVLAVGIGTLFAAAEESCLAPEAKQKMVQATAADLQRSGRLDSQGLVFSRLAQDNANQTQALKLGITQGREGVLFAGRGVAQIDRVLPVHEIVARLLPGASPPQA